MKKTKWFIALMALILVFSMTACGGGEEEAAEEPKATWVEQHAALLESGEGSEFEGFADMKAELDKIREESGAFYVYALVPMTDETPDVAGDANGDFAITVDGSEDPDDYGCVYDWEIQFTEAWEGEAAAARSAWNDSEEEQCWSAFAPVYDSEGNVACILGIDYPCTETIADYPEWNRDNDAWNGFEDEITGEVPEAIQAQIDEVTTMAADYAKQLSDN